MGLVHGALKPIHAAAVSCWKYCSFEVLVTLVYGMELFWAWSVPIFDWYNVLYCPVERRIILYQSASFFYGLVSASSCNMAQFKSLTPLLQTTSKAWNFTHWGRWTVGGAYSDIAITRWKGWTKNIAWIGMVRKMECWNHHQDKHQYQLVIDFCGRSEPLRLVSLS